jgi:hypothetical protein
MHSGRLLGLWLILRLNPLILLSLLKPFPKLTFEAARLPDKLVVVPDIQPAACLFSWPMIDAALFCAKAAFDVVARTSSPAAMVAASIDRKFCSHILLLEHL